MSAHASRALPTAQPTCGLRLRPTSTEQRSRALEISHAARLRARLQIGGDRFVRNVWGVGYRLIDSEPSRI